MVVLEYVQAGETNCEYHIMCGSNHTLEVKWRKQVADDSKKKIIKKSKNFLFNFKLMLD